jgi:anti-sigma B factor antagonist
MIITPTAPPFQIVEVDGTVTVRFTHKCDLNGALAEEFGRAVTARVEGRDALRVTVDLGHVAFLSSMALSKLITLNAKLQATGGRLVVVGANPLIRQIFHVTKLDTLLEISGEHIALPA